MKDIGKYRVGPSEREYEVLPNLLGIDKRADLEIEEARGFINAGLRLTSELSEDTRFDIAYIHGIHRQALGHLYEFAGKLRTVNISKSGFEFPAARFLAQNIEVFQKEILNTLKENYNSRKDLIEDIAKVHGELLFIHPYRDGNGRTARALADLMAYKAGYDRLKFEKLDSKDMFEKYVNAVQKVGVLDYDPMMGIIDLVL